MFSLLSDSIGLTSTYRTRPGASWEIFARVGKYLRLRGHDVLVKQKAVNRSFGSESRACGLPLISENENALTSRPMPCAAGLSGFGPLRIGSARSKPEERTKNVTPSRQKTRYFRNWSVSVMNRNSYIRKAMKIGLRVQIYLVKKNNKDVYCF